MALDVQMTKAHCKWHIKSLILTILNALAL